MSGPLDDDALATYVRKAVDISLDHVRSGGIPFSAVIVNRQGEVLGTGFNRVRDDLDPLAHAEIVAMRNASRKLGRYWLADCVLVASGEPCALCYYSALYFNVQEIVFAVGRHDAARFGFDYTDSYRMLAVRPEQWKFPKVRAMPVENALAPFEAWQQSNHVPGR